MVAVDILGPFPESNQGNIYILVVGDYFTRWMEAFAIPNQEATTVARILTQEVFCRFSPPEQLHSDQGRQFESELIAEVCKLLGIAKTRTTPYHPQSDGLVERFNRTLLSMLRTAATFEWEEHLRPLCMAITLNQMGLLNASTVLSSPCCVRLPRKTHSSISDPSVWPITVAYSQPPAIDLMYGDPPSNNDSSFTLFCCKTES